MIASEVFKRRVGVALGFLCVGFFLGGCTGERIVASVSSFYDGAVVPAGSRVAVVPRKNQASTLEWEPYARHFARELERAGFEAAIEASGRADGAAYAVDLEYSIRDSGRLVSSFESTTLRNRDWRSTSASQSTQELYDARVFVRFWPAGEVRDGGAKPRAEIRVMTRTVRGDLSAVMRAMAEAAFRNWPGEEGRVYDVSVGLGSG